MTRIGHSFNVPVLANMVEGGRTPILSWARFIKHGYRMAPFPTAGFPAVPATLRSVYATMRRERSSAALDVPLGSSIECSKPEAGARG